MRCRFNISVSSGGWGKDSGQISCAHTEKAQERPRFHEHEGLKLGNNFSFNAGVPGLGYTVLYKIADIHGARGATVRAARNGGAGKMRALIVAGDDVTYFDSDGLTPLMQAAKLGHADIVRTLLEAGAPWNALSPSNHLRWRISHGCRPRMPSTSFSMPGFKLCWS
ncbi:hypothetical protein L1049_025668 [Liquidambar formosana]|uniref:Uncharacterized protein n=1 Tax=Liquidambar formosana TaxID=63359 RepID=A0AAP0NFH4_LIQFO